MATLYIIHCIDMEDPLDETSSATFQRLSGAFGLDLAPTQKNLSKLKNRDLDGKGATVARMLASELLAGVPRFLEPIWRERY